MASLMTKKLIGVFYALGIARHEATAVLERVKLAPPLERQDVAQKELEQIVAEAPEMPELVSGLAALIGRRVEEIDVAHWD